MKKLQRICVFILIIILLSACGEDASTEDGSTSASGGAAVPGDLRIGASTIGGFWYTLAASMGEQLDEVYPGTTATVIEGGSISNLAGMADGTFEIAFSSGPMIHAAREGTAPFDEKIENVSTIATLYPTAMHIVVREDSDIYTIEDLAGKIVSPGVKGYGSELAFIDILEVHGMSYDDIDRVEYVGTSDGADLLRDRHIDAIATIGGVPNAVFQELASTVGIRLIPLGEETVDQLQELNEGYIPHEFTTDDYDFLDDSMNTIAPYTSLLVNDDLLDEEAVYELTKMLFEDKDRWKDISTIMDDFDAAYSIENNVGKINPGAERYYEEIGVLD
ncbi:TAXI family TRAP transporter solute-binding subunit [Virgibacillus kimchii]